MIDEGVKWLRDCTVIVYVIFYRHADGGMEFEEGEGATVSHRKTIHDGST